MKIEQKSNFERREYLRSICPCRTNSSGDVENWQEVFNSARFGSYSERKSAAHTIGTMLQRATTEPAYRELLKTFQSDLDALMQDPRSASAVLDTMKKHGHAHKGAARQAFRNVYKSTRLRSASEIVNWINGTFKLKGSRAVTKSDDCVSRLVKWVEHRVAFQPERDISHEDLIRALRRFRPSLW